MKKNDTRSNRSKKRFQSKQECKHRRHRSKRGVFGKKKAHNEFENGGDDDIRFTQLDHAPDTAQMSAWLPPILEILKVPKGSILRRIRDQSAQYTAKHRVALESHSDKIHERLETENDFKSYKKKLANQGPGKLIEEGGIQTYHKFGLCASTTLLVSSFGATIVVTGMQVQAHSSNGSWVYGLSIGLIAAFGSSLLKWSLMYPYRDYRKRIEMILVPVAFGFFGLFVYELTDLFFYMEKVVETAQAVPDFSKFLLEGSASEAVASASPLQEEKSSSLVSLKWFYIGVLGTEMFSSYAFLSFIETCSIPQPKALVRAINAQFDKIKAPRRDNRKGLRKSRGQFAWLQYLAEMSHAPGKAIHELFKRLTK